MSLFFEWGFLNDDVEMMMLETGLIFKNDLVFYVDGLGSRKKVRSSFLKYEADALWLFTHFQIQRAW